VNVSGWLAQSHAIPRIDFCTIGGLNAVAALLASPSTDLRAKAAHVVGTVAQNNPPVQAFCLRANLLKVLMQMMSEDPEVSVRAKALFALSGTLVLVFTPDTSVYGSPFHSFDPRK
jgi:hypothetical protein